MESAAQAVRTAAAAAFPGGMPEGLDSLAADLEVGTAVAANMLCFQRNSARYNSGSCWKPLNCMQRPV